MLCLPCAEVFGWFNFILVFFANILLLFVLVFKDAKYDFCDSNFVKNF